MKKRILTPIFVCSLAAVPTAWALNYVVKSGDTLSAIARRHIPGKIYGKSGSLAKLISENPKLAEHPNKIFIGQKVAVSESSVPVIASHEVSAQISESEVSSTSLPGIQNENSPSEILVQKTPENQAFLAENDAMPPPLGAHRIITR